MTHGLKTQEGIFKITINVKYVKNMYLTLTLILLIFIILSLTDLDGQIQCYTSWSDAPAKKVPQYPLLFNNLTRKTIYRK